MKGWWLVCLSLMAAVVVAEVTVPCSNTFTHSKVGMSEFNGHVSFQRVVVVVEEDVHPLLPYLLEDGAAVMLEQPQVGDVRLMTRQQLGEPGLRLADLYILTRMTVMRDDETRFEAVLTMEAFTGVPTFHAIPCFEVARPPMVHREAEAEVKHYTEFETGLSEEERQAKVLECLSDVLSDRLLEMVEPPKEIPVAPDWPRQWLGTYVSVSADLPLPAGEIKRVLDGHAMFLRNRSLWLVRSESAIEALNAYAETLIQAGWEVERKTFRDMVCARRAGEPEVLFAYLSGQHGERPEPGEAGELAVTYSRFLEPDRVTTILDGLIADSNVLLAELLPYGWMVSETQMEALVDRFPLTDRYPPELALAYGQFLRWFSYQRPAAWQMVAGAYVMATCLHHGDTANALRELADDLGDRLPHDFSADAEELERLGFVRMPKDDAVQQMMVAGERLYAWIDAGDPQLRLIGVVLAPNNQGRVELQAAYLKQGKVKEGLSKITRSFTLIGKNPAEVKLALRDHLNILVSAVPEADGAYRVIVRQEPGNATDKK